MYKAIGQSVDNKDFSVYVISQFSHIHMHIHTRIRLSQNLPFLVERVDYIYMFNSDESIGKH